MYVRVYSVSVRDRVNRFPLHNNEKKKQKRFPQENPNYSTILGTDEQKIKIIVRIIERTSRLPLAKVAFFLRAFVI